MSISSVRRLGGAFEKRTSPGAAASGAGSSGAAAASTLRGLRDLRDAHALGTQLAMQLARGARIDALEHVDAIRIDLDHDLAIAIARGKKAGVREQLRGARVAIDRVARTAELAQRVAAQVRPAIVVGLERLELLRITSLSSFLRCALARSRRSLSVRMRFSFSRLVGEVWPRSIIARGAAFTQSTAAK